MRVLQPLQYCYGGTRKQVDAFIKREFEKHLILHELKKLLQTVKEEDKSEAEKILEQAWGKELTEQA